jgi:hypothetical protein
MVTFVSYGVHESIKAEGSNREPLGVVCKSRIYCLDAGIARLGCLCPAPSSAQRESEVVEQRIRASGHRNYYGYSHRFPRKMKPETCQESFLTSPSDKYDALQKVSYLRMSPY